MISIKAGFALQEDFNAYAQNQVIYTCACSSVENLITLENTGDVASVYGIKQEGTGLPYSALNPSTFGLKPGESNKVYNFITAPCDTEGKYDLTTKIDTRFGLAKEFTQTVDVRKCVNIDVIQTKIPEQVCPCTPVRYDFVVKNTGDFLEMYSVNVSPSKEYVAISDDNFILGPGQSKEIYVFINTPCGMYGDFDFYLTVDAEKSGMRAEMPLKMHVNACYDYTLYSNEKYNVCQDTKNDFPVNIANTANVANSYSLSTDSGWGFFEPTSIFIPKNQNANLSLVLYPAGIPEGEYNLKLTTVSERGQLVVDKPIDVTVTNCYSINLYVDEIPDLVSCEQYTALAHAANDGSRENQYSFSLYGENWASLGLATANIKAGEIADVPIKITAPCDNSSGLYEFTMTANITDFAEKVAQQKFSVNIIPIDIAYSVEVTGIKDAVDTDHDGGSLEFSITNTGIRGGKYNIFYNTTEGWITLDQSSVSVAPGESAPVNLVLTPLNDTPEGEYYISIMIVPEGKNVGYQKVISITLKDKTAYESIIDLWPYLLVVFAMFAILIVMIILLSRKKETKETTEEEEFWKEIEGEPSRIEQVEKKIEVPAQVQTPKIEIKKEEYTSPSPLLEIEGEETDWKKWLFVILAVLLLMGATAFGIYYFMVYQPGLNETNASEMPQETEQTHPITAPIIEESNIVPLNESIPRGPGLYTRLKSWITAEIANMTAGKEMPIEGLGDSTIYINRTGLKGYENVVEVKSYENVTIPVTIRNNYPPNIFKIKVNEDVDWIDVDKKIVEIQPNEQETLNIIVTPDAGVEKGNYKINIKIDVEGRTTPISEEIILDVNQERPFYLKYLRYILAGLAVLVLFFAIVGIRALARRSSESRLEEPLFKEQAKEIKHDTKHAKDLYKDYSETSESFEDKKDYGWLKYLLFGVFIIILLAGAIYGAKYAMQKFTPAGNAINESLVEGSIANAIEETSQTTQPTPIENVEKPEVVYEKVFVKKNEETSIPLRITNANQTTTFKITVNEEASWITVDQDEIEVKPNENGVVNIIAYPDDSIEDGDYKVTVEIKVAGQEKTFTKGFIMQVRKNTFSGAWSYLAYAAAGIFILIIALVII
ncbi:MAG: hypothetical protein NT001_04230, partial [Candidatus Woesearchaeota archaeon]|nr:hypothetical protein [Candidatus Woesearchaeota archaeon]